MPLYEFTLLLEPLVPVDDAMVDALYPACDDGLVLLDDRQPGIDFSRHAANYREAIESAIQDVESSGVARVRRVEPVDVVNASQIVRRTGLSREEVLRLCDEECGQGGFPEPLDPSLRSRVWRWHEVRDWMAERDEPFAASLDETEVAEQRYREQVREVVNAALQAAS